MYLAHVSNLASTVRTQTHVSKLPSYIKIVSKVNNKLIMEKAVYLFFGHKVLYLEH